MATAVRFGTVLVYTGSFGTGLATTTGNKSFETAFTTFLRPNHWTGVGVAILTAERLVILKGVSNWQRHS